MSSFNKISEDLLYYIALNIERDLSTLSSLSLVCRTFHRATRALLFRHIGRLSSDKSQLLQRSLAENPDLKAHVRSHHIELKDGNLEHDHLKKALVYPNINELTISRYIPPVGVKGDFIGTRRNLLQKFWYGRSVERDFECEFLDNNDECPFAEIQSISLKQDFTTTEIIRFMLLPSGQVLRASDLDIMKEARLPVAFAAAKSNVTELELLSGRLWRIEPVAMRSILSFCPHLRVLRCQVPMETKFNGQDEITSEVIRPVSPKSLNAMFEPVRDTLQELSLLNLRHTVPYDGSRMDLSGFRALRDLEVTSCCLLRPGAPCVEWEGLGDSLPVGLRKLKIDFPRESGIFYHHLEGKAFLAQDLNDIPFARYAWILQLLRHKVEYLPDLAKIEMVDPPGTIGYWPWQTAKWTPPLEVAELCKEGLVEVDVRFSYPHPGSEMESWNNRKPRRYDPDADRYRQ